ncbi:MAG: LysM peptidoglycan-binding domain-containing protein [Treponema sp.]|jgi:tetratricopeptide (TPR) repeat protein|nr:LysM peptidoglycan-binding domain-containing protein [Treponema sp.]
MRRGILLFAAILSLGGIRVFAAPESSVEFFPKPDLSPQGRAVVDLPEPAIFSLVMTLAQAASTDAVSADTAPVIPQSVRNNRFYTESLRLANLARIVYDGGDYDSSAQYAEEAVRNARLSDEYIALQLKIRETNNAITAAKRRLDQTAASGALDYFPNEYAEARSYYDSSIAFRAAQEYDQAIDAANRVMLILADLQAPPKKPGPQPPAVVETSKAALPAQYMVRPWNPWRDCLWNIAGRSWAYGDSAKWRIIYEANRSKFPQPDNPNLIHPGMVLDIPSIQGEVRQGMWNEKTEYPSLR